MLPQLVFVAASIVVLGAAYRWAIQEVERVEKQMSRLQRLLQRVNGDPVPLQLDPKTGIYLPVNG
jgi:hypothetical protein